jgi:FkbM family methyltransferase
MSVIKNIAAFKNWPMFYAGRYGLLRNEFEIVHRNGIRIMVRPHTDDLMIVKSNWVTHHYMRDFIPIKKDSIVMDVGAHIGSFTVLAAKMACKVLAFEPAPSNYEMLKKNVELNGLKNTLIFEMAVSGVSGYQEIFIYDDVSSGTHSLYQKGKTSVAKKWIQTISIEDIIKQESLPRIDFLKLDCEGAEHDIFKNMSEETAAKIRGIAMETHPVDLKSSIDIQFRLKELGFEVKVEHQGGYVYARKNLR